MNHSIVLVVAAHADDEAIGCAGTILRHTRAGDEVHLLFMTDGVGSRGRGQPEVDERRAHTKIAGELLNVASIRHLSFPDNRLDTVPLLDVVIEIEKVLNLVRPNCVYTHHSGDLNIDHELTARAVMTACRPQPQSSVSEIYAFEVLSSTEWSIPSPNQMFNPTYFVDISNLLGEKQLVLESYAAEMREVPHARSVENILRLAKFRGATVGLAAAEAFVVLRKIKSTR